MKKSYSKQLLLFVALMLYAVASAGNGENSVTSKKINLNSNNAFTSITDPGWSYTCDEGIEVELISLGLKNNVPATLTIPDVDNVDHLVVEIVYKGNNPGPTIEIEDADGNIYTAQREVPGGSSNAWYYRTEMPATASVSYKNTTHANYAQSILAYVFRHQNTGMASSGIFTSLAGYNNIVTTTIPIQTDSGPRSVSVELPISELTDDGRYIHIEVSAADGSFTELTEAITSFAPGTCCIKIFELNLQNVAGTVDEIEIKIDTRNQKNGQNVNGQSWVMGGAVKTDVRCSCVDFDTTPPTADNLVDHILLEDISQMPTVTFSDECSAVTVDYNEFEANESCWVGFGPVFTETNITFDNFPFDKSHHWENGYFQQLLDGTAKIHGRVVNNTDTTSGWIVEIFFDTLVDYNTWVNSGGYMDNDALRQQRLYANVDFTKPYTFEGFGDYANATIILLNNTNFHHMDIGPKNEYGDYGVGFKISYEGVVNGQTITASNSQNIEMFASLNTCVKKRGRLIIRQWTVTDAAGNSSVFIQRVELE